MDLSNSSLTGLSRSTMSYSSNVEVSSSMLTAKPDILPPVTARSMSLVLL